MNFLKLEIDKDGQFALIGADGKEVDGLMAISASQDFAGGSPDMIVECKLLVTVDKTDKTANYVIEGKKLVGMVEKTDNDARTKI